MTFPMAIPWNLRLVDVGSGVTRWLKKVVELRTLPFNRHNLRNI